MTGACRPTPREGDRVRVTFGPPHPGWMTGEVLQSNPRKHRCIVRWDANRMTDLVSWDRITVLVVPLVADKDAT